MHEQQTQNLYNNAALKNTGRERDHGQAIIAKKYHNRIKGLLIEAFAQNTSNMLDLGTGRGGDLHKWMHANIKHVYGIDASVESVIEAQNRLANMPKITTDVDLECITNFGEHNFASPFGKFNAVSCMFALHYFFKTERMLHQTIRNIAQNLYPGGIFFGCVPHGIRVLELFAGKQQYKTSFLNMTRQVNARIECFGSSYDIAIADTVTSEQSKEFLVFENVLVTVAACYGLVPIIDYPKSLCEVLCKQDDKKVFKHFDPAFIHEQEQAEASRIFCTFSFIKQ